MAETFISDIEFEEAIEKADPITKVTARMVRQMAKEFNGTKTNLDSLRSEMNKTFQHLPCVQGQDCFPKKENELQFPILRRIPKESTYGAIGSAIPIGVYTAFYLLGKFIGWW